MPTITTTFCFDVPHINRIEGTPCALAVCPACRIVHALPADTKEVVRAKCANADSATPCADYWVLLHGGPAPREMVLSLETGDKLSQRIVDAFMPRDMWWPYQTIDCDPTKEPNVVCLDLETQRAVGDEFERSTKKMTRS